MSQRSFSLGKAAKLTGFSKQHILQIINQYPVVRPEKSGTYGSRTVYKFSLDDVEKLAKLRFLKFLGYSMREAVGFVSVGIDTEVLSTTIEKAVETVLIQLGLSYSPYSLEYQNWFKLIGYSIVKLYQKSQEKAL